MSRDDGFAVGDRSTRTLYDTRLIRAVAIAGPWAAVAWDAVTDASWEKGERVTFEDAVLPLPYRLLATKMQAVREALCRVGLLDKDGLIREESWAVWFKPAYRRREAKRERDRARARRAADARWRDDSESLADRERAAGGPYATVRTDPSDPSDPSVPSDSTEGSTGASEPSHARPAAVQPLSDWFSDPVRAKSPRAAS